MRIIICGTRTFADYKLLERILDKLTLMEKDVLVLSGTAKGADTLGEKWALSNWYSVERYHPDYDKYGREAPLRRNTEMAKNADGCVAFWDGRSPGTAHMLSQARKYGLKIKVVRFTGDRNGTIPQVPPQRVQVNRRTSRGGQGARGFRIA